MGNVTRLYADLHNTPHLVLPAVLDSAMAYLASRNGHSEPGMKGATTLQGGPAQPTYSADGKTGTIHINGPLSYRNTALSSLCGLQSYQTLVSDVQSLADQGMETIVLCIDSGGGESYGCLETASSLRKIADDNGVRLVAYVDGIAASAAYGIASACHEVIANPEGQVGSIGVVVKLRNASKALQQAGIEDTYVFAGQSKIPFNKSGGWNDSFITDLQNKVDSLYSDFTSFVAKNRGLSVQAITSTEARMFLAKDALNQGLVDAIMTRADFTKYLSGGTRINRTMNISMKKTEPTPLYVRNPTTGMLQRTILQPLLSEAEVSQRMERLKNFGQRRADHIFKATEGYDDEKFEIAVRSLEFSLGVRRAS